MMQGHLTELELYGVFDAGIPNLERVVLRIAEHVDMASFAVVLGQNMAGGSSLPLQDHFFWFGNALLTPGDWIYLYTGTGAVTSIELGPNRIYSLYWGKKQTLFHTPLIRPVLIRMDAIRNQPLTPGQTAAPTIGINAAKPLFGLL